MKGHWLDGIVPDAEDVQHLRPLKQKHEMKTRAQEAAEAEKEDEKALEKWRLACRTRDKGKCRVCGRKVIVTLKRIPKQATTHHIEGRANRALRHDQRNGLTCCLEPCHDLLQRRELVIVQDKAHLFTLEPSGKHFWNADHPMEFKRPEDLTRSEKEQR
jgi:hypothetical protein